MRKRKGLGIQILVFMIIAFLLFSVIGVMVVYLNPPVPTFPQDINIQDVLSGSNIQLSGANIDGAKINILPTENGTGVVTE